MIFYMLKEKKPRNLYYSLWQRCLLCLNADFLICEMRFTLFLGRGRERSLPSTRQCLGRGRCPGNINTWRLFLLLLRSPSSSLFVKIKHLPVTYFSVSCLANYHTRYFLCVYSVGSSFGLNMKVKEKRIGSWIFLSSYLFPPMSLRKSKVYFISVILFPLWGLLWSTCQ